MSGESGEDLLGWITGERGPVAMPGVEMLRSVGLTAESAGEASMRGAVRAAIESTIRADAGSLPSLLDLWAWILHAAPQCDWANFVAAFGAAMQARFERTGAPDELAAAVNAHRAALDVPGISPVARAAWSLNLGQALRTRFGLSGLDSDADEAIRATEEAAAGPAGPVRTLALQNLNLRYRSRYEKHGDLADLDRAVTAGRAALPGAPPGHPERAAHLQNVGISLRARYARTGAIRDLDEAIGMLGEAVDLAVAAEELSKYLSSHAAALLDRFNRTGRVPDLDLAVELSRRAVATTSPDDPGQAVYLLNACAALLTRFRVTGQVADLHEARAASVQGVAASGIGHPWYPAIVSSFAEVLRTQGEFFNDPEDLDLAAGMHREALAAVPEGHRDRAPHLTNLGASLLRQAERNDQPEALHEVVNVCREAVAATPADDPARAGRLSGLGNALASRFERFGAANDADEAVAVLAEAAAVVPAGHADRNGWLHNLGLALWQRYLRYGRPEDLDHAATACAEATRVRAAPPLNRIRTARTAAILAEENNDPAGAADLLETGVRLLPELVPRRLPRFDQQARLSAIAGLANRAASAALASTTGSAPERAARAVTLLEAGRAVLISQSLETRGDLTGLRAVRPDLATRFAELTEALNQHAAQRVHTDPGRRESAFDRFMLMSEAAGSPGAIRADEGADRIRLAEDLAETVRGIREVDGFASFGLPPDAGELLAEAENGPLVAFTVTADRGNALIVTPDGIESVELPGLTTEALAERADAFHRAVRSPGMRELTPAAARPGGQAELHAVLEWLWDNVTGPVLDHLGLCRTPAESARAWPRIWWIPCGQLALLPLHAAGHHRDPATPARRTVLDRVVSSYTPTIGALRHARRSRPSGRPLRSLVVAMPTTPGLYGGGHLPHVRAEAETVAALLPDPLVLSAPPDQTDAGPALPTARRVLDELPSSAIAHFACHGTHNPAQPEASMLLLHDHAEAPLTVAHLVPLALDHAQLAYLSSCESALNKAGPFLDEAIHLAAAFQLTGFPHVIGTLWAVDDEFAAVIASRFYCGLRDQATATVSVGDAARALHEAVRELRDEFPGLPSLWAAHLHFGP
ncbi:CHAT domain-containing protein [Amycolatopsis sp. FU40]|uniref:CHAT domain-containing protein n=1 Tax=Amycolatopsis sp. FU40 TaxID=2914159 RepID=UPI001F2C2A76|nr:CHAT domain-containing protein [Amycolatopsis sp. FU40]UKD51797.1 CHAT domain-containing protein [Amycolatopsis sp. FU40]